MTQHMVDKPHGGATKKAVAHVLNHWILSGVYTDAYGGKSRVYLGFAPGVKNMMRVAVSWDDERIVSAFQDRNAMNNWNRGNRDYFTSKYSDLEERSGT